VNDRLGEFGVLTMTTEIHKRIWALSPHIQDPESYLELSQLTSELIRLYETQGRLLSDPFGPTRERTLSLPFNLVQDELRDSICLVTGGLGCVGSALVKELVRFQPKIIIIVDILTSDHYVGDKNIVVLQCDIRDADAVGRIFDRYKPTIVFHTAAQRNPGLAELNIFETVNTNVIGTLNIISACESVNSVKQLVTSSTGKASRYITDEVYAGTKKIMEFTLDSFAKRSTIKYSMTRCTHILDNSLMNAELKSSSLDRSFVSIHSPGKYVTAQNAQEAAYLMLNALAFSEEGQCNFLLVRHLEWPVESLEMALYYIRESGRSIPVVFVGNPVGYSEKFFRGQLDWTYPEDLNMLINVYENEFRIINQTGDIIISKPCSSNRFTLTNVLSRLKHVHGENETKIALQTGLRELVRDSLKTVNPNATRDILRWGLDSRFLEIEHAQVSDFQKVVSLLVESLNDGKYEKDIKDLKLERFANSK